MAEKVLMNWSGGKDSAKALYEVAKSRKYEVAVLLTTLTKDYDRVSMHGVRRVLLEKQAESLGIPLEKICLSKEASNDDYEAAIKKVLLRYKDKGISQTVFGDIFLEDLRKYREANLARISMKALFPIWKRDTKELAREFIREGFEAIITCVDSKFLGKEFAGRIYDETLLSDLPMNVDPCGENGEFHSFVYNGPIFKRKIALKKGEVVLRNERFYYCDLIGV